MPPRLSLAAVCMVVATFAQDFSQIRIEKLTTNHKFVEGPVWSREGFLVFSDIPANQIFRMLPPPLIDEKAEGKTIAEPAKIAIWRADSGGANGNALDAQGRLYTCEGHGRRVTRTDKKGKVEVLADHWQSKRFNSPNDIVVRRDGHAWFTDPAFGSAADTRELDFNGIFHISPKGGLTLAAKWTTRPNGVALSPDGRILYVADSDRHEVHAFDIDRAGEASHDHVLIGGISGVPDGLRTDEKGNLYVAASSIWVYTPAGALLGDIPVGEKPSNCAFGDADFQTLYITARTSVYRVRLEVKGSVQY
jgi:sugar lactone lactonase YvrE